MASIGKLSRGAKLHILVVDDHALMWTGIRALLRSKPGWKVVSEAASGKQAVEQAMKLKPDVAIVDIEFPDLDGVEAIRQIRKTTPKTQVLTFTVHGSGQIRRALKAGARGYVKKSDPPKAAPASCDEPCQRQDFIAATGSQTSVIENVVHQPLS